MNTDPYPYSGHRCTEHDHSAEIEAAERDSDLRCDIEDAFWTSVALQDWVSVVQWVHGFIQALRGRDD